MLLLLCVFLLSHHSVESVSKFPKVLIVSMDAFKPDYVDDCLTPSIARLRTEGAYAPFMKNVFPTKTFPNHHSIATGVQPGVHGVLDSTVYASKDDCANRSLIGYSYELFHYNKDILPIWTLNQLAGKGRHSGVMMWPGGEFSYGCRKTRPTFSQKWDEKVSYQDRIDTVLSWFLDKNTPANLVMLYLEEPDLHGHAFGIDSAEVRDQIKRLDKSIDYINQQLKTHNLDHLVTVFVVSDHGMINLHQRNIIDLNEYVDNSSYVAAGSSPVLQIFPKDGLEDSVFSSLQNAKQKYGSVFNIYTKTNIPTIWHYSENNRTPPILVVANEGYAFQDMYESIQHLNKKFDIEPNPRNKYGIHGYSNSLSSMHPIFFAWGHNIKSHIVLDPFNTTELYPLWAFILNLEIEHEVESTANFTMLLSNSSSMTSDYQRKAVSNVTQQPLENIKSHQASPLWMYWFFGFIAVVIFMIIVGMILHFCRDMNNRSSAEPIIPQYQRNFIENQHLLVSDSEEELKL
ncbi:Ectonucleotide pyrophosphatase/phosphodiesterase family member 5 [Frankliniella fusca]|uniref:Ectonucleotide pyrophosphatase/phosphodiesterase family member 5 n=1 Tax=Frankliniella fusca TaxID=407009 RepID=A0AAE1LNQ9_9NEOP|nr:Ectonucleotide pyrophosphatase/phosphodiesterase family member 5 [Frankliniella fusca]